MKTTVTPTSTLKGLITVLMFLACFLGHTQNASTGKITNNTYPETFNIPKSDVQKLLEASVNTRLSFQNNPYLNQSTVQLNTLNGDMHFVKIQLSYFSNSYLMLQVNGSYSTIVFILSEDKSVFYKGKMDPDQITMRKCAKDDIVSE
jgi:hypothetical protein